MQTIIMIVRYLAVNVLADLVLINISSGPGCDQRPLSLRQWSHGGL